MRFLLDECGADVTHTACLVRDRRLMQRLLSLASPPLVQVSCSCAGQCGPTLLQYAADNGRNAVVEFCVVERGIDVDVRDDQVRSPCGTVTEACT